MSHSVLAHFLTNGHAELLHGAAVGLQAIEEGAASLLEWLSYATSSPAAKHLEPGIFFSLQKSLLAAPCFWSLCS